eukprot:TRINITY_DN2160_c0_g1_i1.p1 TRINITY_DN2160_c0_g1~~TRINITY_DN2160_c0_g1_i1.p1  ORF type:complete len:545 (+),score=122.67 TRINITY_DN2160_c0_g1_i1:81-1715(+)
MGRHGGGSHGGGHSSHHSSSHSHSSSHWHSHYSGGGGGGGGTDCRCDRCLSTETLCLCICCGALAASNCGRSVDTRCCRCAGLAMLFAVIFVGVILPIIIIVVVAAHSKSYSVVMDAGTTFPVPSPSSSASSLHSWYEYVDIRDSTGATSHVYRFDSKPPLTGPVAHLGENSSFSLYGEYDSTDYEYWSFVICRNSRVSVYMASDTSINTLLIRDDQWSGWQDDGTGSFYSYYGSYLNYAVDMDDNRMGGKECMELYIAFEASRIAHVRVMLSLETTTHDLAEGTAVCTTACAIDINDFTNAYYILAAASPSSSSSSSSPVYKPDLAEERKVERNKRLLLIGKRASSSRSIESLTSHAVSDFSIDFSVKQNRRAGPIIGYYFLALFGLFAVFWIFRFLFCRRRASSDTDTSSSTSTPTPTTMSTAATANAYPGYAQYSIAPATTTTTLLQPVPEQPSTVYQSPFIMNTPMVYQPQSQQPQVVFTTMQPPPQPQPQTTFSTYTYDPNVAIQPQPQPVVYAQTQQAQNMDVQPSAPPPLTYQYSNF